MRTKKEYLLELINGSYRLSGSVFPPYQQRHPIIDGTTTYLQLLNEDDWDDTIALQGIMAIYKPLLAHWYMNKSSNPSAELEVLQALVNELLQMILPKRMKTHAPSLSLNDIGAIEARIKDPNSPQNHSETIYSITLLLILGKVPIFDWLLPSKDWSVLDGKYFAYGLNKIPLLNTAQKLIALQKENHLKTLQYLLNYFPQNFHDDSLLSQINNKKVKCQNAIFNAFWMFHDKGLLMPDNMACITNLLTPLRFDSADNITFSAQEFLLLAQEGFLTDVDKATIGSYSQDTWTKNARIHVHILTKLNEANLLRPNYKAIALSGHRNRYNNHSLIQEYACNGLIKLEKAQILTTDNAQAIQKANTAGATYEPEHAASLIIYLNKINALNAVTRAQYLTPNYLQKPLEVFRLLERLDKANLLEARFTYILGYSEHLTENSLNLLHDMPDHLFTSELWHEIESIIEYYLNLDIDALLELSQQAILMYLRDVLNTQQIHAFVPPEPIIDIPVPPIVRYQWGKSQTTHAPSVEDTTTSSWFRLEKRYPLSVAEIAANVDKFEQFARIITSNDFITRIGEQECKAAQICLMGLITEASVVNSKEKHTKFPTSKMLALIWEALIDTTIHDKTIGLDAKEHLIRELSNAQQGAYDGANGESCFDGKTHELLNGLNGIHPDVKIVLINQTTIADLILSYAKKILKESFLHHMQQASMPQLERQAWYESCLKQTEEAVIHHCQSRLEEAEVSPENITLFITEITKPHSNASLSWIKTGLQALRANSYEYILAVLEETYKNHSNALYMKLIAESLEQQFWTALQARPDNRGLHQAMITWLTQGNHHEMARQLNFPPAIIENKITATLQHLGIDPNIGIKQTQLFDDYYETITCPCPVDNALLNHIDFIFKINNNVNAAIESMQTWIQNHAKLTSILHRIIINHFIEIYQLEQKLLQNKEAIFNIGLLSQNAVHAIIQDIAAYYQSIVDCRGTIMPNNGQPLLKKLSQLDNMIDNALIDEKAYQIERFFPVWFAALEEKNFLVMEQLYQAFCDPKLLSWVTVVVRNIMTNPDIILSTGERGKNLSPYDINCLFLYAMLCKPHQWMENFAPHLQITCDFVNNFDEHDALAGKEQHIKRDSYPPILMTHLSDLLQWQKWLVTPYDPQNIQPVIPSNIFILPQQVEPVADTQNPINHLLLNEAEIPVVIVPKATLNHNVETTAIVENTSPAPITDQSTHETQLDFKQFCDAFNGKFSNTNSTGIIKIKQKITQLLDNELSDVDNYSALSAYMKLISKQRTNYTLWNIWARSNLFGNGRSNDVDTVYHVMKADDFNLTSDAGLNKLLAICGIPENCSNVGSRPNRPS